MKRALGLGVLVFLLAWAAAVAEGYTSTTDPQPRVPEPSRVILWDDEPPKSSPSVHHARGTTPSGGAVAVPATS
jgi:hypothetical protein